MKTDNTDYQNIGQWRVFGGGIYYLFDQLLFIFEWTYAWQTFIIRHCPLFER